jgi:hypothetical protein
LQDDRSCDEGGDNWTVIATHIENCLFRALRMIGLTAKVVADYRRATLGIFSGIRGRSGSRSLGRNHFALSRSYGLSLASASSLSSMCA